VDRKWKQRQEKTIPTAEAMRVCAMRDVGVDLQLRLPSCDEHQRKVYCSAAAPSASASVRSTHGGVSGNGSGSGSGGGGGGGGLGAPTLQVETHTDSLRSRFTLEVSLDEVFGPMRDTSLARSGEYRRYLDSVMDEIDGGVDDLYCDDCFM
jgi:hypothetical protein